MIVDNETSLRRPELSAAKRAVLEKRLRGEWKHKPKAPGIARRSPSDRAPLSFAQQRLWFFYELAPESPLYNISMALRLKGRLDREALEKSLAAIVTRHESLRTRFVCVDGEAVQLIDESPAVVLREVDPNVVSDNQRDSEIQQLFTEEASHPFNLSSDLMLRAILARLDPTDHVLLLTSHHIASDGWSLGVLLGELTALYEAFVEGRSPVLPELPIQYADFAVWQREGVQTDVWQNQLAYWKRQLAGAPEFLELPTDRPRPAVQTFQGCCHWAAFPKPLSDALKGLSRREGATLFMTLMAAFQTLLHRYTGRQDILVGSPIAGRNQIQIEGLIGVFVNTLVLRGDLSGDPTFRELLQRVRNVALGAYAHPDLPFEKLVEELHPARTPSHSPLVQVLFVLQNAPSSSWALPGLSIAPIAADKVDTGTAKFDLTLQMEEGEGGLRVAVEYNTDLFEEATIGRLLGHFQTLLEGIVADPNRRLSELPLLTAAERHQLLVKWNETGIDHPKTACVHELFEQQARRTPDNVALEFEGKKLTYAELNVQSDRLAAHLRSMGVRPDGLVGLCVERSPQMIIGVLGILKAGGAYVPLDPAYPKKRLAFVLSDAQIKLVVTETRLRNTVSSLSTANDGVGLPRLVCMDQLLKAVPSENGSNAAVSSVHPENLAYVLYTSGSTGEPKGVQIEHRSVVNFLESMRRAPGINSDDVLLAVTTLSFDIAALELLLPLATGARVVLASRETASDADDLVRLLEDSGATVMQATPATWRMLLEAGWKGHPKFKILCGGDSWNHELADRLLQRCGSLWNMYGPTETTIWSAASRVTSGKPLLIACPINNTQFYIVDASHQPVPIGIPGELCIGGEGVARGYVNRPELTGEKFIADPFSRKPGARLYRTGDLARYRSDGGIEFLGRMDQQVKVQGFRIELGEIESVLNKHSSVRHAVVSVREEAPGDKRLVAYLVPASKGFPSPADLRQWLSDRLPEYMVPSAFVVLETLPLTPNGKVDRKKLPAPAQGKIEANACGTTPRDMLEQQLVKIWEKILGVRPVGLTDNFFELGGHSLISVRLSSEIKKLTGRSLPLATLFQTPTVGQLARILRRDGWSPQWQSLVPIQPGGSRPPLYCVHGGGGNVLFYRDLARHLGSDYPFYGLQCRGLDGNGNCLTRVEDMASAYLKEIRELQPEGPYYLGGFCMGGSIAFEMAQQLTKEGQRVALLAMFDSYNHNGISPRRSIGNRISYLRQKVEFHLANVLQLALKDR